MPSSAPLLVLGSSSPRRREILTSLGIPFAILTAEADERVQSGESPEGYVERVVLAKLEAVSRAQSTDPGELRQLPVLVADTTVTLDGRIFGKPEDDDDALRMLEFLAGRTHRVLTCHAIGRPGEPRPSALTTVTSEVTFAHASREALARYVRSGEPRDKAGAYAIQGLGSFLVTRLSGSYSSVVGLSAAEVVADLLSTGVIDRFPLTLADEAP